MRICKYCYNSGAKPCFAVLFGHGYDDLLTADLTLNETLRSYDVAPPDGQDKRLVFQPEEVPAENDANWDSIPHASNDGSLLDYIRLRDATETDRRSGAAVIDGKVAELKPVTNIGEPLVIRSLACSECHTVLPIKEFSSDNTDDLNLAEHNFRITLVANTSAGKTNLTAAMYDLFKEETSGTEVKISEPLFEWYYRHTSNQLRIFGVLPDSTGHSTPPLSVTFRNREGEPVTVDIVDTKGEITRVIDYSPCLRADLIIILVDIRENDTVSEEDGRPVDYITDTHRLSEYIAQLSGQILRDKRIILAFSKCDKFMETAAEYMFCSEKEELLRRFRSDQDSYYKNMRNIRNYHFSHNLKKFVQTICTAINENAGEKKRISENDRTAITRIVEDIVKECNNISRHQTDIMCVAPLGTSAYRDGDLFKINVTELKPCFVDELVALIKFYGGGAA